MDHCSGELILGVMVLVGMFMWLVVLPVELAVWLFQVITS